MDSAAEFYYQGIVMAPKKYDDYYKICWNFIIDTFDPHIVFDETRLCNYCINFKTVITPNWYTCEADMATLQQLSKCIITEGKGKEFDCIIGLSGRLDSSYITYVADEKFGLRL